MRALQQVFIFIVVLSLVAQEASAQPATLRLDAWTTNGAVNDFVQRNGILYLGGEFTNVSMATGFGAALSARTALPFTLPRITKPSGTTAINAVVPDGAGGWYVGGDFTQADDSPHTNLVHIFANGQLDFAWRPDPNLPVRALALRGNTLYVGGDFTLIGGQTRNHLAALNAANGQVMAWDPKIVTAANITVRALVAEGRIIYAGGTFTTFTINNVPATRSRLAAIDSANGTPTPWHPNISGTAAVVNAIAISGTTVYVGGKFTTVGTKSLSHLAAINAVSGNPLNWEPNPSGTSNISDTTSVYTLAVNGATILVGGSFTSIGKRPSTMTRKNIAAVEIATANATDWDPSADRQVNALVVNGGAIYVAGKFMNIGGKPRELVAAIDAETGAASTWVPDLGTTTGTSSISALAFSGATVYIGGNFAINITLARNRLAAFDIATGRPTTWNPNAGGTVNTLSVSGRTVYAGGSFTTMSGVMHNRLAALDAVTGNLNIAWNPNPSGEVNAIAPAGTTVYVGGSFSSIGGKTSTNMNLAALDSMTGQVTTEWASPPFTLGSPATSGPVRAIAVRGPVVYVGGDFTDIGGLARNFLAALKATNGEVITMWDAKIGPGSTNTVRTIVVSGSTIYAGGKFTLVNNNISRNSLAAFEAGSGMQTPWNPNASGDATIRSLTIDGSRVYLGGVFSQVSTEPRNNVAAVDIATASIQTWNPSITGGTSPSVNALEVSGGTVFIGGAFSTVGAIGSVTGTAQGFFAPIGETLRNPPPTVTSMSPATGTRLQTLDVFFNGTNFVEDVTAVNVGSRIAVNSLTFLSSTRLRARITITSNANTGVRNFVVSNNPIGGGSAAAFVFTVTNPAPTLQSIMPESANRGQTTPVIVTGSNFIDGATTLNLGPDIVVTGINVFSPTRLTATITIGANAAIGARNVAVTNASPIGGTATLPAKFKVNHTAPTLVSLAPASGNRLQTLNVDFIGTGFMSDVTTVNVDPGIRVNSTTITSATQLTANLTITAQAPTGPRAFSVTNGEAGGGASESSTFTISNPAPTLARLEPSGVGRGETRNVLLKGANFIAGVSTVSFDPDDIIINSIAVKGDTQITANVTIPLELPNGFCEVKVTNAGPGGGVSPPLRLDLGNPRPTLLGVTPAIGALGQSLDVELTGTNFVQNISSVDFGEGIMTNSITVSGSKLITANITIENSAPVGGHDVSVINDGPGGGTITLSNAFAVVSGAVVQFSVPTDLHGGPGDTVKVPLNINPNGRRIGSFDAKLNFDPEVLSYLKCKPMPCKPGPILAGEWFVDINLASNSAAVDIGAYTNDSPFTQSGTVVILHFLVNKNAAVGTTVPLVLNQLASTNASVTPLPNARTNGLFTVKPTTITGKLFYFVENKPLAGDTVIVAIGDPDSLVQISDAHGNFEFEAVPTGRNVVLTPHRLAGNFPEGTITAGDALQAFKGWEDGPQPLNGYESLAADVNGDCQIMPGDALAILKRATGRWQSFRSFFDEDWRFIDADFNVTAENWCEAPASRVYEPFTRDQVEQDFVGILRGDVNGSFGAPISKTAAPAVDQGAGVALSAQLLETGDRQLRFAIDVSAIDQAYNSFDLKLQFDAAAIKIANVACGDLLVAKDWQMDWNAAAPGILRVAGFSMTEAAIQARGTLVIIQATLPQPIQTGAPLNISMPLALFGRNGKETRAQTATGPLQFTAKLPQQYALEQNYPNPFVREIPTATTIIKYALPQAGMVELRIYDMLGNLVRTLMNKPQNAGVYTVTWNGRKDNGAPAVSGVYFYRLKTGTFTKTNKLVLQK